MLQELFGSATAEKVILYMAYLGEGHIRRIAKDLFNASLFLFAFSFMLFESWIVFK